MDEWRFYLRPEVYALYSRTLLRCICALYRTLFAHSIAPYSRTLLRCIRALYRTPFAHSIAPYSRIECASANNKYHEHVNTANTFTYTQVGSFNLLLRKLDRVRERRGPENARWESVGAYMQAQTATSIRIAGMLLRVNCNTLQDTATHCKTLQHTATHCNTLKHTATHLCSSHTK